MSIKGIIYQCDWPNCNTIIECKDTKQANQIFDFDCKIAGAVGCWRKAEGYNKSGRVDSEKHLCPKHACQTDPDLDIEIIMYGDKTAASPKGVITYKP